MKDANEMPKTFYDRCTDAHWVNQKRKFNELKIRKSVTFLVATTHIFTFKHTHSDFYEHF